MRIKKNVDIEVKITPLEMAKMFWYQMDSRDQALFFNAIGTMAKASEFANQLQTIIDDPELTYNGLKVMRLIGVYADEY